MYSIFAVAIATNCTKMRGNASSKVLMLVYQVKVYVFEIDSVVSVDIQSRCGPNNCFFALFVYY